MAQNPPLFIIAWKEIFGKEKHLCQPTNKTEKLTGAETGRKGGACKTILLLTQTEQLKTSGLIGVPKRERRRLEVPGKQSELLRAVRSTKTRKVKNLKT